MEADWELAVEHSGGFLRLTKLLEKLSGFHAVNLQHNSPAYRDGLIRFINRSHPRAYILELEKNRDYHTFESTFIKSASRKSPIHLIGLEDLNAGEQEQIFRGLNYHREHLSRSVQSIVLFWLTESLIRDIAEKAPDFWAWREQVFDFHISFEKIERHRTDWSQVVNTVLPDKQIRLTEIENYFQSGSEIKDLVRADLTRESGQILWSLGKYSRAKKMFEKSAAIYKANDDALAGSAALADLADLLFQTGSPDEAMTLFKDKVLPVYETLGDVRGYLVCQVETAMNLFKINAVENRSECKMLLCSALKKAKKMNIPEAGKIRVILKQMKINC